LSASQKTSQLYCLEKIAFRALRTKNNLTTVFAVDDIPKDTQMRQMLDAIAASQLDGIFSDFLHRLQRGKHLANYQLFDGSYLVAIDGSEYFSSENIRCPHCLVTESKGKQRYLSPRSKQPIPNSTSLSPPTLFTQTSPLLMS
jgi:hypothetical protein